jgi:hypothetical protein
MSFNGTVKRPLDFAASAIKDTTWSHAHGSRLGRHFEAFIGEGDVADDAVMEGLEIGAVVPDVVRTPATAELVAGSGELADEGVKLFVGGSPPASVRRIETVTSANMSQSG